MLRHWLAVLAAVGVVAGCNHPHRYTDSDGPDAPSSLQVVNHNFSDVDVYIVRDGQRTRVGTVNASSEETFPISSSVTKGAGTLQLVARAVGANGAISSETFSPRPGGIQLSWTLEANLSRASLTIF